MAITKQIRFLSFSLVVGTSLVVSNQGFSGPLTVRPTKPTTKPAEPVKPGREVVPGGHGTVVEEAPRTRVGGEVPGATRPGDEFVKGDDSIKISATVSKSLDAAVASDKDIKAAVEAIVRATLATSEGAKMFKELETNPIKLKEIMGHLTDAAQIARSEGNANSSGIKQSTLEALVPWTTELNGMSEPARIKMQKYRNQVEETLLKSAEVRKIVEARINELRQEVTKNRKNAVAASDLAQLEKSREALTQGRSDEAAVRAVSEHFLVQGVKAKELPNMDLATRRTAACCVTGTCAR